MLRLACSILANVALSSGLIFAQPRFDRPGFSGLVIDEGGKGIPNVLVVASGAVFNGWATTDEEGSFRVSDATPESADAFDGIIRSVCFDSVIPNGR